MKVLNGIALLIGLIALSAALYLVGTRKKIAYVDNMYLFENSNIKKELFRKFENDKKIRKAVLDSLRFQLESMTNGLAMKEGSAGYTQAKSLQETYYYKEQSFNEELKSLSDDYTSKVWAFINEHVLSYGKEQRYDYLLGANGQGSMMYANEKENISEVVLKYINEKYEGN